MDEQFDGGPMEPLIEVLRLIKRRTELEMAMRRPGGIRITEEREVHQLRGARNQYPAAVTAILEAASRTRKPVYNFGRRYRASGIVDAALNRHRQGRCQGRQSV
jgi:hypothetical protein